MGCLQPPSPRERTQSQIYATQAWEGLATPNCIVAWFMHKWNALEHLPALGRHCEDRDHVRKIYSMARQPVNPLAEVTTHQLESGSSSARQPRASTAHDVQQLSRAWQPPRCSSAHGLPGLGYHQPREDCAMQTYCKGQRQGPACQWVHTVKLVLVHLHCQRFLLMPN